MRRNALEQNARGSGDRVLGGTWLGVVALATKGLKGFGVLAWF